MRECCSLSGAAAIRRYGGRHWWHFFWVGFEPCAVAAEAGTSSVSVFWFTSECSYQCIARSICTATCPRFISVFWPWQDCWTLAGKRPRKHGSSWPSYCRFLPQLYWEWDIYTEG